MLCLNAKAIESPEEKLWNGLVISADTKTNNVFGQKNPQEPQNTPWGI